MVYAIARPAEKINNDAYLRRIWALLPRTATTSMTAHDASPPLSPTPVMTRGLDGQVFADAQQTDPRAMGWMQGQPVPPDKRIAFADGSNYRFPQFRWSFAHTRELVPTRTVARASQAGAAFTQALNTALWQTNFQPMTVGPSLRWADMLAATYTDAIVVLHQGRVVLEHYNGVMHPQALHVMMSVSKSVAGLLASEFAHQGLLDPQVLVTHYLPEMQASGFAGATVRQVMDMTTGIDYSENYADPQATIWNHMYAGGMLARPPGAQGPDNFFSYLPTVGARGTHGAEFTYRTVNTDVLGWILQRVAGCNFSALVSKSLWQPMGAELDACYTVDSCGVEFVGGGLNASVRDMARLGELLRQGGRVGDQQVIAQAVVEDLHRGADPARFVANGPPTLPGWSYRNMWWISHNANRAIMARGVHGQNIYIDPRAEMVIARFASHPVAANAANDIYTLPAYQAMADALVRG